MDALIYAEKLAAELLVYIPGALQSISMQLGTDLIGSPVCLQDSLSVLLTRDSFGVVSGSVQMACTFS